MRFTDYTIFMETALKVLIGAVIAFIMELSEFLVVTYTSSLTLSIGGIFKDIFILILAVEWNGDQMSFVNFIGLLVCLTGISSHVIHKIQHPNMKSSNQHYLEDRESNFELGEPLISERTELLSESEDEKSDTQELFNILHSRDR